MKRLLLLFTGFGLLHQVAWSEVKLEVNLLETTDLHMHMVDYDYYADKTSVSVGLARTAALINQAREDMANTFLVDNGDLLQGNPLGDYMARVKGVANDTHPAYKAMNLLKYDVGNVGNHEYNFGLEFLKDSVAGAQFPYLSSNSFVVDGDDDASNDKTLFNEYVILQRDLTASDGNTYPIKVGFMGFVPPQIMQWDADNLNGKIYPTDIVDTAEKIVAKMEQEGVHVIVAIPHSGIKSTEREDMAENASYYLSTVDGIDAILFGHSHGVFPSEEYKDFPGADIEKGLLNGVAATMPGFWGSHLGHVSISLLKTDDGWDIVESKGQVLPIYETQGRDKIALVEPVQEVIDVVATEHEEAIDYMNQSVGETLSPIHSYFALVADDPSIQIVNNAQIAYAKKIIQGTEYDGLPILSAGAPFKAGGRGGNEYYTDIPQGDIKLKNVSDLYIYPNTVQILKITGADVREWLEMSALAFNKIDANSQEEQALLNEDFRSYNFDVIDGVSYEIDLTQDNRYNLEGELINEDARRIVNLKYDGKPIDETQEFIVVSNNYRAQGGGKFPGINDDKVIIKAPDENRTALANYLQDQKSIQPKADENWNFADNLNDAKITFISGPGAEKYAEDLGFKKLSVTEDGFVKFSLK